MLISKSKIHHINTMLITICSFRGKETWFCAKRDREKPTNGQSNTEHNFHIPRQRWGSIVFWSKGNHWKLMIKTWFANDSNTLLHRHKRIKLLQPILGERENLNTLFNVPYWPWIRNAEFHITIRWICMLHGSSRYNYQFPPSSIPPFYIEPLQLNQSVNQSTNQSILKALAYVTLIK